MNKEIKNKLFGRLAVESAEIEPVEATDIDVEETVDQDNTAELVGDAVDVKEADDEVEDIENVLDATETLDDAIVAVEAAILSKKGITDLEALALHGTLKASVGRYTDVEYNMMPAREAFHKDQDNIGNAVLALEGMKANAAEFFKAIMAKIKAFLLKLTDIFKAIKDRLPGLNRTFKQIQSEFKDIPPFESQKIKFNTINFVVNNQYDKNKLVEQSETALAIINGLFSPKIDNELIKWLAEGISTLKDDDSVNKFQRVVQSINALSMGSMTEVMKDGSAGEDGRLKSAQLPGNRIVYMEGNKEDPNELILFGFTRDELERTERLSEIDSPSSREIIELADNAFLMFNAVLQGNRRIAILDSHVQAIYKHLDFDPNKGSDRKSQRKESSQLLRWILSFLKMLYKCTDFVNVYTRDIINLGKATLKAVNGGKSEEATA